MPTIVKAIKATGLKQIIIAGVVTDVCVAFPTLSALVEGFEVFVVTDASGTFNTTVQQAAWARRSTCSVNDHLNITVEGVHSTLTNNVKHSSHDPKLCMCRHGSAFHHWQNQALARHLASRRAKTGCTGCGKRASRLAVTAWKSTSLPGG